MSRLALASQALQLSQQILAPVPVGVRVASIVQSFLRQAFTADDVMLAIGIQALVCMEKANTQGPIQGSTIDELRPYIKRNVLGKLKTIAKAIGGKIFNLAHASRYPLSTVEEAWHDYIATLQAHPISSDKEVGQVITYIANGFKLRILDVVKVNKRRDEIKKDPEVGDSAHGLGGGSIGDKATWNEIERKFKQDKRLQGPSGEPLGWIYLDGKAGGMTEEEIVDAWNQASRANGGPGDWTRARLVKWRANPVSGGALEKLTKQYVDKDVASKIRVAVQRGTLDRVLLTPFERELLLMLA